MSTTPIWHVDDLNFFNVVIIGSPVVDPSSTAQNLIYSFGGWQGRSPNGHWFVSADDSIKWIPNQTPGQIYAGAWNSYLGGGAVFQGPARSGTPAFPYPPFNDVGAITFIASPPSSFMDPTPAFWYGRNEALNGNAWMTFKVFAPDFLNIGTAWQWAVHYWNTPSPITATPAPPTNTHILV